MSAMYTRPQPNLVGNCHATVTQVMQENINGKSRWKFYFQVDDKPFVGMDVNGIPFFEEKLEKWVVAILGDIPFEEPIDIGRMMPGKQCVVKLGRRGQFINVVDVDPPT